MAASTLGNIAQAIHASEAAIRLLASIFLGFPIAILHRYTLYGKQPVRQHLYFAIWGLLICYWNFGYNTVHSLITFFATYLVIKTIGGTSLSVIIAFLINMGYLLCGYYTTSTADYDIKWTMPQCVSCLRLIGLTFNLWDAQKSEDKLSAAQKEVALKKQPSLLEMAAFVYFPGSFLIGPQFSMKRYLDYVDGRLIDKNATKDSIVLPDCIVPSITRLVIGFIYVALFQLGTMYVTDQYIMGPEFLEQSFIKRLLLIGFWGHVNLYKYISCWLLTEGVCMAFGLTYNGKDEQGKPLWNGCENVKLITLETATRFGCYIEGFNMNTNKWCAEYVFKRLRFLNSKLLSQFLTLLFLAVWHGFHSGYYVCFFLEFIVMYAERDACKMLSESERLQALAKKYPQVHILSWIVTRVYTFIFMGYCLTCFILLTYPRYNHVYGSIYYCGHVIYLSYPVFSMLLKRFVLRKRPRKTE